MSARVCAITESRRHIVAVQLVRNRSFVLAVDQILVKGEIEKVHGRGVLESGPSDVGTALEYAGR